MKPLWGILVLANCAFLAYLAWVLPDRMISRADFHGTPTSYMSKTAFIVMSAVLLAANNVLFGWLFRLRPGDAGFKYVNLPHKTYWLSTPERQAQARVRVTRVAAMTALYVNGISLAILYQTYWYHFRNVPCPRPLALLAGILAAGGALI